MTTKQLQKLLDVPTVAELLGVGDSYVRLLVRERRIPYVKWGHYIRFDPTDVAKWIQEAKVTETTDVRRFW